MKKITLREARFVGVILFSLIIAIVLVNSLDSLNQKSETVLKNNSEDNEQIFPIDINEADLKTLIQLPGIGESKANLILKKREELGKFSNLDELLLVKGIGESTLSKMKDLICIEETGQSTFKDENLININTASSEELQSLPGIGEVKAQSILNYRKNHEFTKPEELLEVNGIGEKTLENLKNKICISRTYDSSGTVKKDYIPKININKCSVEELREIPGIDGILSDRIVKYREIFGKIHDEEELKNINGIDNATIQKIHDYITF